MSAGEIRWVRWQTRWGTILFHAVAGDGRTTLCGHRVGPRLIDRPRRRCKHCERSAARLT